MSSTATQQAESEKYLLKLSLTRQELIVLVAIFVLTSLAWAYTVHLAKVMEASMTAMADMPDMPAMSMNTAPWGLVDVTATFVMWAVMMVAMMLPSATPAITIFARASQKREPGALLTPTAAFASGYLASWTLYSLAATGLQWLLHVLAMLNGQMAINSSFITGCMLVVVGVYQWSPWKYNCLKHCQSPIGFIFGHWRPGAGGAFRMGLEHGFYCIGCCWLLMMLLFAVGIMNLVWVAGIAIYVLLEKLLPLSHRLSQLTGVVVIAWGVLVLVGFE